MQTPPASPVYPDPEEIILQEDEEVEIRSESSESSWSPRFSDEDASGSGSEEEEDYDERYDVPPEVAKKIVVEWLKIVEQSEQKMKRIVSKKEVEKQLAYALIDMFRLEL